MLTRQHIYTLLIVVSAGLMLGRIIAVNRTDMLEYQKFRFGEVNKLFNEREKQLQEENLPEEEFEEKSADLKQRRQKALDNERRELPVFSANDRSRWNTIRVLVEPDKRVERTINGRTETVWYAIDKAQNVRGWDTIDMVKHDLPDQPGVGYLYSSKPPLLPTVMAIPYALMYRISEGKLSLEKEPFIVVRVTLILCNLLPLVLGWFLLSRLIDRFGATDWGRVFAMIFVCFGTFLSTFVITLNNHLPGVVCVTIALYCAVRIVYDQETRWRYYAAAGFFGAFAVACDLPALLFCALIGFWLISHQWKRTLLLFAPAALVVAGAFFATNYTAHKTFLPAYAKKYAENSWYLYEYERGGRVLQSYWGNPSGIDKGEEKTTDYVFHSTIGHHGLFSLTPVWILSFIGLTYWLFDRKYRSLSAIILLTSVVVFGFYMLQPLHERNYGGMTSGLRWMFWFVPLWSLALVAAADRFSRNGFFRAIALLCLVVSMMSVAYPIWNPWTMPWTYNLLEYLR